ncbi:hypothetical protein [Geothermobacter ehrlichii]|uniref:hypothetical protein n=1 Tax=Geothermobacter ehrlichii TaxID=213224 RepID=UPI0011E8819F|nr:hypothetical protein [Geothermobacter ehrlichii]
MAVSLLEKVLDSTGRAFPCVVATETRQKLCRSRRGNRQHFPDAPPSGLPDGPTDTIDVPEAVAEWAGKLLRAIYQARQR